MWHTDLSRDGKSASVQPENGFQQLHYPKHYFDLSSNNYNERSKRIKNYRTAQICGMKIVKIIMIRKRKNCEVKVLARMYELKITDSRSNMLSSC